MPIIIDPDNLDRNQVIFNTTSQRISLYPAGAINGTQRTDGATTGTLALTSATYGFTANANPGDILCIFNGPNAGHYVIDTVDSNTQVTVEAYTGFTAFGTTSSLIIAVRDPTGGSMADGATLQAVYSYAKDEWRVDSQLFGGDNLIRHPFPFEAITSEQFEMGGGTAHDDWIWTNGPLNTDQTRYYLRTAGWAEKSQGGTNLYEYSGIVTLGTLDADAQVYYQQTSATTTPVNFVLQGAVNQAILVNQNGGPDNRTYLKLFVRKKGKTYAGSAIADIGVTTIQTITNRFPLGHLDDAAITATDGAILGSSTFRGQRTLVTAADGSKTLNGFTFTSAGSNFTTSGVAAGDALRITEGSEQGYYTILSVDSATQLTIAQDANFTSTGWGFSESTLDFTVTTAYYFLTGTTRLGTDGALADVSVVTGTLTSATSNFTTAGVAAGDMVIIVEAASNHRGVYKVISRDSATQLTLNTTDKAFTTVSNIDFYVIKAGMYLQYKKESISNSAPTSYAFDDVDVGFGNRPTITRASGTWDASISAGDILTITLAEDATNIGSFTVYARESATVLSLIPTDVLVLNATDTTAVIAVDIPFKRTINSVVYGFNWRLFGIDALLSECYEFVQHQLRQITDIDYGPATSRGDVTDLLMSFASPTGTTFNLVIDNLDNADTNNVTYTDATNSTRVFPYVAAGAINFNDNLVNDADAKYWMFFTTNPAGNYGTSNAVIVDDALAADIAGTISANPSISFTFDYDGNVQGGRTAGTNADVTVVAIGLTTAQFVITQGTITRSKSNNFSLVAALERNYVP